MALTDSRRRRVAAKVTFWACLAAAPAALAQTSKESEAWGSFLATILLIVVFGVLVNGVRELIPELKITGLRVRALFLLSLFALPGVFGSCSAIKHLSPEPDRDIFGFEMPDRTERSGFETRSMRRGRMLENLSDYWTSAHGCVSTLIAVLVAFAFVRCIVGVPDRIGNQWPAIGIPFAIFWVPLLFPWGPILLGVSLSLVILLSGPLRDVERLRDPQKLAAIASGTGPGKLRLKAIKNEHLTDQELLSTIARSDSDANLRQASVRKLEDQGILSELARSDDQAAVRSTAVERLEDQELLARIARSDENGSVRSAAVRKLEEVGTLQSILERDPEAWVRQAARKRLTEVL